MGTLQGSVSPEHVQAYFDEMVTAARWAFAEDAVRLAAALRPALQTHGIPANCYVNNGSAFVDSSLIRTCARLGMKLTHSKPYRPQGRGKIERFLGQSDPSFSPKSACSKPRPRRPFPGTAQPPETRRG
ncbi:hypothetical protein [Paenarthrobacter sp. PH39-S1]|uniref:hypothetical protein n=1 Tax=Paenarthrobacter sp. PH39-S1 TaxID=3046204 RepID=UPI0024BA7A21|nr:hypothetical protein [Paenarthrobacter sp. PH39-S1]MDJ0358224.1 hypothetical protein [Paenarthrobacter sp. PH39-S1]